MPIQQRKFIIMKHNMEQEGAEAERKKNENKANGGNSSTVNGVALNAYAKMEQQKRQNL